VVIPHVPPAKRHPYDQWSPDARALDLVGDKWTLLIVRDLLTGPRRFVELQRVLPGISTEQLRSRLNRMVADGMLTRKRYREVPPRVDYELTGRARELAPVIGALARWGYEWAWGAPRPTELVDVTATFRLLPGLVATDGVAQGTVLLVVSDGHAGRPAYALLTVDGEGATVREPAEPLHADATVEGSTATWVQALEPMGDPTGLARSGRADLADYVLGLLSLGRGAHEQLSAAADTA
jgi:DNA-binding HxlR family transcriptional regulator